MTVSSPSELDVQQAGEVDSVAAPRSSLWALVWRTTLVGVLLGCCFPLLATFVDVTGRGLPFSWAHAGAAQAGNPLHWIIDTAPLFLGLAAYVTAVYRARHSQQTAVLNRLLERTCRQLDSASEDLARVGERHREAQERRRVLELAFEQARDGMALLDPTGNIAYANKALADMHGHSLRHLVGRHASYCFTAKEYANGLNPLLRRALGKGGCDKELTHLRADGTAFPTLTSATSVMDDEGGQVGIVVYCRDIEQERETAQALVAEKDRAQNYFDLAGTMIVALDRAGCVTKINRMGCELLGYAAEDILGSSWFDHYLPDAVGPEVHQVFSEMMEDNLQGLEYVENHVRDRAGRLHLIAWHNRILRDDTGRVVGSLASGEDITYQRAAERALRRSEQKLAGMVASMQEGIVYSDEDGIVQTVNPYFCDFVGVKAEQIVGQRLDSFHSPELQARVDELSADARRGSKRIYSVERELAGRHVTFRIQPVSMGEDFLGMVMNIHDITEQRTARLAAEEASRAKSSFLASVSHEIRTPMNGVLGMTAMLLETDLTEEQNMFASTVQESAEALLSLINDVLDFSKVEAGKLTLGVQDFNMNRLLEGVRQILAPQADQKRLEIMCCGDPDLPLHLCGDESRLRQILLNLGGNAVKFTDAGCVALSAERVTETVDEVTVRFTVLDTGAGVATDEQRRLFDSFYQVDGSDTRQHGGSGLGLAICKQLVELMGGTIGLESDVGEGSLFWFTVTLARATTPAVVPASAPPRRSESSSLMATLDGTESRSGRILVVDDNQINRRVALALLERLGYEVVVASSGKQALTMTATPFFDLVFMDLQMPGMDGLETTRTLRTENHVARAGWPLPVVALTAHARMEDRDRCLAAGMDDYITKPLRQSELLQILDRHLPASACRSVRGSSPVAPDELAVVESMPTAKPIAEPAVKLTAKLAAKLATKPGTKPGARPTGTVESCPVFCHEELLELLGGNDTLLPQLLTILREDTGRMMEQLRQAIVAGASQSVSEVGHALKGVLESVAGRAAAQTANTIERLGREHAFDLADRELVRLEGQIAQLTDVIEDYIAQPVSQPA